MRSQRAAGGSPKPRPGDRGTGPAVGGQRRPDKRSGYRQAPLRRAPNALSRATGGRSRAGPWSSRQPPPDVARGRAEPARIPLRCGPGDHPMTYCRRASASCRCRPRPAGGSRPRKRRRRDAGSVWPRRRHRHRTRSVRTGGDGSAAPADPAAHRRSDGCSRPRRRTPPDDRTHADCLWSHHFSCTCRRIVATTRATGALVSISRSAAGRRSGSMVCCRWSTRASSCGRLP